MNRRDFLAAAGTGCLAACGGRAMVAPPPARPDYLVQARRASAFIEALAVETPRGLLWRKSPDEPGVTETDLYHGSAGPALFFLELHRATGEPRYLRHAERGADHIAATMPEKPGTWETGLLSGLAGHGVLFLALARSTGQSRRAEAAGEALRRLEAAATADGYPIYDVFQGMAGVILWLLDAGPELGDRALALAVRLGDVLLARAQPARPGQLWMPDAAPQPELPNFSHGTAGIAFALARLHQASGEERFLTAALAGAEHLLAIAYTDGDVCLVPHALPAGRGRYYLGYCHGPVGTSRLFHQLGVITGDRTWSDWFRRSVNGVLYSGAPEARTPGFWDNAGQCCGSAAIGEFMLSLHRLRADDRYLDRAHAIAAHILARATPTAGGGAEWIHAENRIDPFWKQSYTGYLHGAAGIGSFLVRLAGHDQRASWKVQLPDNPFPV